MHLFGKKPEPGTAGTVDTGSRTSDAPLSTLQTSTAGEIKLAPGERLPPPAETPPPPPAPATETNPGSTVFAGKRCSSPWAKRQYIEAHTAEILADFHRDGEEKTCAKWGIGRKAWANFKRRHITGPEQKPRRANSSNTSRGSTPSLPKKPENANRQRNLDSSPGATPAEPAQPSYPSWSEDWPIPVKTSWLENYPRVFVQATK